MKPETKISKTDKTSFPACTFRQFPFAIPVKLAIDIFLPAITMNS